MFHCCFFFVVFFLFAKIGKRDEINWPPTSGKTYTQCFWNKFYNSWSFNETRRYILSTKIYINKCYCSCIVFAGHCWPLLAIAFVRLNRETQSILFRWKLVLFFEWLSVVGCMNWTIMDNDRTCISKCILPRTWFNHPLKLITV